MSQQPLWLENETQYPFMKSEKVKITISFTFLGTMTLLYEVKMGGLSSNDNMFTAMLL